MAFLELTGTDATNKFTVTPSTATTYLINAELPDGSCRLDMGDYLDLNTTQLGGGDQTAVDSRTLHIFTVPNSFVDPLGDTSLNSDGDPSYPDDSERRRTGVPGRQRLLVLPRCQRRQHLCACPSTS